jgi:hypothetical protein
MYDPDVTYRVFEYDPVYDVRANRNYRLSKVGLILGLWLLFSGFLMILFNLIDMDWGVYNWGKRALPEDNLIWRNNIFWPTYSKGLWVGLFVSLSIVFLVNINLCEQNFRCV